MLQVQRPQSSSVLRGWPGSLLLKAIGQTLDALLECRVFNDGSVWPAAEYVPEVYAGLLEGVNASGASNEGPEAGSARSETGQGEGSAGGSPAKGATADHSGSQLFRDLEPLIRVGGYSTPEFGPEMVLDDVLRSYPMSGLRRTSDGFTVAGTIQPVADLKISATLATTFPSDPGQRVRAEGWWDHGIRIGPRHVNADRTICAFDPRDGTWIRGMPISRLLDLQAIWIVRQMYLRSYGRWPGRQHFASRVERIAEQLPDEYCGCGSSKLYPKCCQSSDLAARISPVAVEKFRSAKLRAIGAAA